ncbi:MAG: hypothetical protein COS62_09415 [Zetaproteobacteria bacterium CG03_land_8_20_14_0_80_59_51]|nr:MAG: hypothetical protein COX56_09225 [Zetaproteobacteria bacterium CG23_combo_of_CG06-09_8_20_14_all_59_86]PIU96295.1 MAG: hypothetical protein COS62_09415 [Zetaproteobacteria bacterium CG03_land_8_20_14_0_80_59_51]
MHILVHTLTVQIAITQNQPSDRLMTRSDREQLLGAQRIKPIPLPQGCFRVMDDIWKIAGFSSG